MAFKFGDTCDKKPKITLDQALNNLKRMDDMEKIRYMREEYIQTGFVVDIYEYNRLCKKYGNLISGKYSNIIKNDYNNWLKNKNKPIPIKNFIIIQYDNINYYIPLHESIKHNDVVAYKSTKKAGSLIIFIYIKLEIYNQLEKENKLEYWKMIFDKINKHTDEYVSVSIDKELVDNTVSISFNNVNAYEKHISENTTGENNDKI